MKEDEIHIATVLYAKKHLPPTVIMAHTPNQTKANAAWHLKLSKMGRLPGFPDLSFYVPMDCSMSGAPECFFIELKSAKGRLSSAQVSVGKLLTNAGFPVYVCRSVMEATEAMKRHIIYQGART